jgi:uncharacterized membrane protein YeiB
MKKHQRIPGFDLARAYAIFGMYIVNFNIVFGDYQDPSLAARALSLFSGNSSTAFVLLAGMGVSLLAWRPEADAAERGELRRVISRRSWFLFALGMLLYLWWPADILHFYGGYMHLAVLLLFVPERWLLLAAAGSVALFHALLLVVPYETGWDFEQLRYTDFWTVAGFLRNTLYNGWNPIFPWSALFFFGMWLGRKPWANQALRRRAAWWAGGVFLALQVLMQLAQRGAFHPGLNFYLTADYLPPFLPFLASGASAAVLLMLVALWLGERFAEQKWVAALVATGQMTLTHYVAHLTLGMVLFDLVSGQTGGFFPKIGGAASPLAVLAFSAAWFAGSVLFSFFWKKRFKNGPLEMLMRWAAG